MRGWKSPIPVIPLDPPDKPHGRIDITPFVDEACAALGFVHPGRVEWLRDVVVGLEHQPAKAVVREIIKALCQDRPKGSRAPLDLGMILTEAGNADPRYSLEQTIDRALFNQSRARHILEFGRNAKCLQLRFELCANLGLGCQASLDADGRVFESLDDLPAFPMPGCDQSVCRCHLLGWPVIPGLDAE